MIISYKIPNHYEIELLENDSCLYYFNSEYHLENGSYLFMIGNILGSNIKFTSAEQLLDQNNKFFSDVMCISFSEDIVKINDILQLLGFDSGTVTSHCFKYDRVIIRIPFIKSEYYRSIYILKYKEKGYEN